ncbi:hypothetical protein Pla163_23840 [Planctomycetes bacterium Pla163]|uniref:Tripartite tricarboxylate transporter TctB family protein n=1 Tax=Rohdeia mirabilis TaxID=2528008 RepID=A0A518D198_9BACT|nr:hypothetical protein Pla163_23840 [Planctomycetes bacterium Pla163]
MNEPKHNDAEPQEVRTISTLLFSFIFVLAGGALLIWAGSALVTEPPTGVDPRDPILPGILGAISLGVGVTWMLAGFKKRESADYEAL